MRWPRRKGSVKAMEPTARRLPAPPEAPQPDRNAPRMARQRLLHRAVIDWCQDRPPSARFGPTGSTEDRRHRMRRAIGRLFTGWRSGLALVACLSVVASAVLPGSTPPLEAAPAAGPAPQGRPGPGPMARRAVA